MDLMEDQCKGNTNQPLLTSTPKKNINDPLASSVKRDTSDKQGVSEDHPLPDEVTHRWGKGPEEIAELCMEGLQAHPEDKDAVGNQDEEEEVRSEPGDLVEDDVNTCEHLSSSGEEIPSFDDVVSSLNWVMDSSVGNTENIQKLMDLHKKCCRVMHRKFLKVMDENGSLKKKVLELEQRIEVLEMNKSTL